MFSWRCNFNFSRPDGATDYVECQAEHANSKRYLVSQQKSSIVVMNGSQNYECTFNNENLHVSESVTHLGIQRCSNHNSLYQYKLQAVYVA
jgi:hypothetical protein